MSKMCGCGVELRHDDYKFSGHCPVCNAPVGIVRTPAQNTSRLAEVLEPTLRTIFEEYYSQVPNLLPTLFPEGPTRRTATQVVAMSTSESTLTARVRNALVVAVRGITDPREALSRMLSVAVLLDQRWLQERLTNLLNRYDEWEFQRRPLRAEYETIYEERTDTTAGG